MSRSPLGLIDRNAIDLEGNVISTTILGSNDFEIPVTGLSNLSEVDFEIVGPAAGQLDDVGLEVNGLSGGYRSQRVQSTNGGAPATTTSAEPFVGIVEGHTGVKIEGTIRVSDGFVLVTAFSTTAAGATNMVQTWSTMWRTAAIANITSLRFYTDSGTDFTAGTTLILRNPGAGSAGGGGGPVSGLTDVVGDTTPQLGGPLDVNGQSIVSVSNGNIVITPNGTGSIVLDGMNWPQADGTADQLLGTNGAGQLAFVDPPAGGGSGSGSGSSVIDEQTVTTAAHTVSFTGLDNLEAFDVEIRCPPEANNLNVALYLNGDAIAQEANYERMFLANVNGTVVGGATTNDAAVGGLNSDGGCLLLGRFRLSNNRFQGIIDRSTDNGNMVAQLNHWRTVVDFVNGANQIDLSYGVSGVNEWPVGTVVKILDPYAGGSAGYQATDTDAASYISSYGSTLTDTKKQAIDRLVSRLKQAELWASLETVWVNGGDSATNVLKPIKGVDAVPNTAPVSGDVRATGGYQSPTSADNIWVFADPPASLTEYSMGAAIGRPPKESTGTSVFGVLNQSDNRGMLTSWGATGLWFASGVSVGNTNMEEHHTGAVVGSFSTTNSSERIAVKNRNGIVNPTTASPPTALDATARTFAGLSRGADIECVVGGTALNERQAAALHAILEDFSGQFV